MKNESLINSDNFNSLVTVKERIIYSEFLERDVLIDIYLPGGQVEKKETELLLINDGQDLRKMSFSYILDQYISGVYKSLMCVGIHCGADRMNEYGTAYQTDYMGRGAKAGAYSKFILNELLPYLKNSFAIASFKEKSFAGFSLGALSAIDIVWNHPDEFKKAGVFSGALWWRRHGYEDERYKPEKDRIMHLQVQKGTFQPGLKFFFECGQLDETADRNNNRIIDSIEDAKDLIEDLKNLGYTDEEIHYLELENGEHNVETWGKAFPCFLKWGWGK